MRAILIGPDDSLRQALTRGLASIEGLDVARQLDHYPQSFEAGRLVDAVRPDLIFVESAQPEELAVTVKRVGQLSPESAIIGVNWSANYGDLLQAMHAGLREFVEAPFTQERLLAAIERTRGAKVREPECNPLHRVYSFVPAKAGAGASTIALNAALSVAERLSGDAFLGDLDFASGLIGFSLGLEKESSDWDPLGRHNVLDDQNWKQLIQRQNGLDVFAAPLSSPADAIRAGEARRLMRFARKRYHASLVDLPCEYTDSALSLMRESQMVFLVVTPETGHLRLARERLAQLRAERLDDRVEVILNRAGKISCDQVEDVLGYPVYFEFPNEYAAAAGAYQSGQVIPPLRRQFSRFAAAMLGETLPPDDDELSILLGGFGGSLKRINRWG